MDSFIHLKEQLDAKKSLEKDPTGAEPENVCFCCTNLSIALRVGSMSKDETLY